MSSGEPVSGSPEIFLIRAPLHSFLLARWIAALRFPVI
jgi:hypothetical protein